MRTFHITSAAAALAGALALSCTAVAPADATGENAAKRPAVLAASATVGAGQSAFVDLRVRGRVCSVQLRRKGKTTSGPLRRIGATRLRLAWTVPENAANGPARVGLRCGGTRRAARQGRFVAARLTFTGGRGERLPVPVRRLRTVSLGARPGEKHGKGLPDGKGNPGDYRFQAPPGTGGGEFATFWPLATGTRATITEGPHGPYSHGTTYTQDAVDLGLPTGTEIRAGFPGVIARVSTGCAEGALRCGSGYGNYVYLKAADGTCALMAHLSEVDVALGQQLGQYDLIGRSGNTGNSTGPHLHYNHVNCDNNSSLPWAPQEGGSLAEGATITSANQPNTQTAPPPPPPPPSTYPEVAGGVLQTYSDPANAGDPKGPSIDNQATVPVHCVVQGFKVQDGNTNWYKLAGAWEGFWAPADGFYNGAQAGGSLKGTPFVDPQVPAC